MSKELGKGKCGWEVGLSEYPKGHFSVIIGYGCSTSAEIEINQCLQLIKFCHAMKGVCDYSIYGGDFNKGGRYDLKRMLATIYEPPIEDCCEYWISPPTRKRLEEELD